MSEAAPLVVLTLAAVAAGIALGVPLARWQLRNEGRRSQAAWVAAAASVVAIRRELRRRGRI